MTKITLDFCNNHLGVRKILDSMIAYALNKVEYIKFQLYNAETLIETYPDFKNYKAMCQDNQIDSETLDFILDQFLWSSTVPMFTIFTKDRLSFLKEAIEKKNWPMPVALKIASPDMANYDLIDACLESFPDSELFISTGMHTQGEVIACVNRYKHLDNVRFLHCISEYPTDHRDVDMETILSMDGFSDHTQGVNTPKACIAADVGFLEMHFTLSKNLPGKDHSVSKDPDDIERILRFRNSLANSKQYKERWTGNYVKTNQVN